MEDTSGPAASGPLRTEELFALLYKELRAQAARWLRREAPGHTLRPTELVHEVFLRLEGDPLLTVAGRAHFLAIAGKVMRRVLVDHARRRDALKRGGGRIRITLDENLAWGDDHAIEILALHEALKLLAEKDADAAQVVEHRFFGGLTEVQVGEVMDRSERWVRDQWAFARAWLRRALRDQV